MADVNNTLIKEQIDSLILSSEGLGLPRLKGLHKKQREIARTDPARAAYLDVFLDLSPDTRNHIATALNRRGIKDKPTDYHSDKYHPRNIQILEALNNTIVGTIQKTDHKGWHLDLVNHLVDDIMAHGSDGQFTDLDRAIPKVIEMVYGKWKVFRTEANVKVALPRSLVADGEGGYNVGQTEFDESLHYMIMRAHRDHFGKISLVAREEVAQAYGFGNNASLAREDLKDTYADGRYKDEEGQEWIPLNQGETRPHLQGKRYLGSNKYMMDWNTIHKDIITEGGGNIWITRINDSEDPSRIRLVIAKGDRENSGSIKIIGDVFGVDPESGKAVPITFSAEDTAKMMASRQAWQWANSQDDFWDFADILTDIGRAIWNQEWPEWMKDRTEPTSDRLTEAGGDFGREEIEYLYNRYSSKVEGSLYNTLDTNAWGGKYLTEISTPGRVEVDLFIDPLYEALQLFEKNRSERLGKPYTASHSELYQIYQLVKSRLNANPGFFRDGTPTTYFDSFFVIEPQNASERRRQKKFKVQSWQQAVKD